MKTSLDFLPQKKQYELSLIVETILQYSDQIEMIILYGSYARGTYNEPWDVDDNTPGKRNISDYDILVVTATKEVAQRYSLWDKAQDACRAIKKYMADPRILTHDIETMNAKLAVGQYFYSDIKREGILLYDSKRFTLSEKRNLTFKEQRLIAQDYYENWYESAEGFFRGYEFYRKEKNSRVAYRIAPFNLHQAAEHAYKTILLTFSHYIPKQHFLAILGKDAAVYCSLLDNILRHQTPDEEARFKLLEYAYIGGRYDPNFNITPGDLDILEKEVRALLDLTKKICEERIRSFSDSE